MSDTGLQFWLPSKHTSNQELDADIARLGHYLAECIDTLEPEGKKMSAQVQQIQKLTQKWKASNVSHSPELDKFIESLPSHDALQIVRYISHYLNLSNVAEQYHSVRSFTREGPTLAYSVPLTISNLSSSKPGVSQEKIYDTLLSQSIELVLTAHPTQVLRRTILSKNTRIALLLGELDKVSTLNDLDQKRTLESRVCEDLKREVVSSWLSDEIRRNKPTPENEAFGGLAVIEQSLWHAVPRYLAILNDTSIRFLGKSLPVDWSNIKFGTWMGGDRDGNPNVTHKTTMRVSLYSRWIASELYFKEVDALLFELSVLSANDEIKEEARKVQERQKQNKKEGSSGILYKDFGDGIPEKELYRVVLSEVREKLGNTRKCIEKQINKHNDGEKLEPLDPQKCFTKKQELIDILMKIYRSLVEKGLAIIANGRLVDLIRRVCCFGLCLVKLDLRQESDRHSDVLDCITEYLGIGSYSSWDEEQKIKWLVSELQSNRPLVSSRMPCDEKVQEVIDTFRVAGQLGAENVGAYVISMCRTASDILAVELLQKELGSGNFAQRVVPLFETLDDLERSGPTMERLFQIDWYVSHINKKQEIMIGYSDSAKDAGRLASAWQLYKSQEILLQICEAKGIQMTLFHGRGGTVGRGGGPSYLAIQSQPPGTLDGRLRVTEQGEMITTQFGLPGVAIRTLEVYSMATLQATLKEKKPLPQKYRDLMDKMSHDSCSEYRSLVRKTTNFVDYFRKATPSSELGLLNIGSRPSKRTETGGVESLRAIPWIFSFTQTRLLLPSWYGVGTVLKQNGKEVEEMYSEWDFFTTVMDLVEMVLSKGDQQIAKRYNEELVADEGERKLGQSLVDKFEESVKEVLRVTGHGRLQEGNQTLMKSIMVRNSFVDPINLIQVELLKRLRKKKQEGKEEGELWQTERDALIISINGIATGTRNTG